VTDKTQKEMAHDVYQAMFGVEGSDEKGMVGDIKEIRADVKAQNGRVRTMENKMKQLYGMIIGAACAGGGLGAGIGQLFQ